MNKVILCGNLTKNVEVRTSESGTKIGTFCLAIQRNFKNANGEYETDFINCKMFGDRLDTLEKYTSKGSKLIVEGSIQNSSYEKEDGTKQYVTNVMVKNFEFVGSKSVETNQEKEPNDPFAEYGDSVNIDDSFLD